MINYTLFYLYWILSTAFQFVEVLRNEKEIKQIFHETIKSKSHIVYLICVFFFVLISPITLLFSIIFQVSGYLRGDHY